MNNLTVARKRLWEDQKGICYFCFRQCFFLGLGAEPLLFTIEHIIPKRYGGSNRIDNLIGCCSECNQARADIFISKITPDEKKMYFIERYAEKVILQRERLVKLSLTKQGQAQLAIAAMIGIKCEY